MNTETITREELYNLLWTEPRYKILNKYDITNTSLLKKCRDMEIPIPDKVYWGTLHSGKTAIRQPLPNDYKGKNEVILSIRTVEPAKSELQILQEEIEHDTRVNLEVPQKLNSPDPLILNTKEFLLRKKVEGTPMYRSDFGKDTLSINVSKEFIPRALRFMDTLIKALKARGHTIKIKENNPIVIISGIESHISFTEKNSRVKVEDKRWSGIFGNSYKYEYYPNGILALTIGGSEWKDGSTRTIEDCISKIIAKLELQAKETNVWRENWRIEEEKRRERERLQRELEKRQEQELENFKDLFRQAARLEKAEQIRRYIAIFENRAILEGKLNNEIINWINWAREKADWYDPFIEKPDELLSDVNKETLVLKKKNLYGW